MNKQGDGGKEWITRLQQRGETWNCGIWAIWIQKKWMQCWSQDEVTNTFESWIQDNNGTIPAGQDLREHYYAVMQVVNRVVQNSRTGLAVSSKQQQADGKQTLKAPWKYLTAQTSRQQEINTQSQAPLHPGQLTVQPAHQHKMHGKIHKKSKSTHTASAARLLFWLQGNTNAKTTGKVHHDRNDGAMQHNTSSTAGCKMPPFDHSRHVHKPESIQACFANTTLKENAAQQLQSLR